jgi:hypothetical protein
VNLQFALDWVQVIVVNKYYRGLRFVTLRAICFKRGVSGILKQKIGRIVLKSISLLILFEIKRNFQNSGRNNLCFYL